MAASAAISSVSEIQAFVSEYFRAWQETDVERIMPYYSDDAVVFAGTTMAGKEAVENQFVRRFVAGFPGNRHIPTNMILGRDVVVFEWSFEAEHTCEFAGRPATGSAVKVPGLLRLRVRPRKPTDHRRLYLR